MSGVTFNHDKRFDFSLSRALVDERRLADIFAAGNLEKFELKTEYSKWQTTGNIAVEYSWNGKPSGIAATQADYWVHELRREETTVGYFMYPIDEFREICRQNWRDGNYRIGVGDDGLASIVLVKYSDLLK